MIIHLHNYTKNYSNSQWKYKNNYTTSTVTKKYSYIDDRLKN